MGSEINQFYQQLKNVHPPIASSPSLPSISYSAPEVLELEKQAIFKKSWIGIGRADQWTKAGDYSSRTIIDIPVIITRDETLQLKAYVNSCRHRGARLLESGDGRCKTFSCPFHRWTYQLNGSLLQAPEFAKDGPLNKADYGLLELPIAEQDGFVFIGLSNDLPPLPEWLGDFSELHAPWNFPKMRSYKRHLFTVKCNWKAFLDVFNEYYHLPFVHPDSLDSMYLPPEPADQVTGQYASQFGRTDGNPSLLQHTQEFALPPIPEISDRAANGTRYSWLFPNMTFAANKDAAWMYEALPIDSQNSEIALTLCLPEASFELEDFEERAQYYFKRLIAAVEEDIPALENQQAGLNAPISQQGRYHELLEPNVAGFAFWYSSMMQQTVGMQNYR